MSEIPAFPYADLWEEREILSVANLTRADLGDVHSRDRGVDLEADSPALRLVAEGRLGAAGQQREVDRLAADGFTFAILGTGDRDLEAAAAVPVQRPALVSEPTTPTARLREASDGEMGDHHGGNRNGDRERAIEGGTVLEMMKNGLQSQLQGDEERSCIDADISAQGG